MEKIKRDITFLDSKDETKEYINIKRKHSHNEIKKTIPQTSN